MVAAGTPVSGMWISSHAAGGIIVDVKSNGEVYCDRMRYTKRGRWSFRHVMETGEAGESVMDTLRTGFVHEAARDANSFKFRLLAKDPIYHMFCEDEKIPGGTHMKVMFALEVTAGELRDFTLQDGDETLGPIEMVEIGGLIGVMEGKTPPLHVNTSKSLLVHLARNPLVYDRYQRIIHSWNPPELTEEELSAIAAYRGKWR